MNSLAPVQRARPRTQGSRFIRHAILARPPVSLAAAPSLCCCLFLCLHVTNRASQGSSGPMTFGLCPCQLLPWIQSPSLHQWLLHQGTHPSIHPFTCLSIHSLIHLSIHPSTCPSTHSPVHPTIHLSIHPPTICLSIQVSICLSIQVSTCPFTIHWSIHLSTSSTHPSIHLSILIYPSIHPSIYPFIYHPFTYPSIIHSFTHSSIYPHVTLSLHPPIYPCIHPSTC